MYDHVPADIFSSASGGITRVQARVCYDHHRSVRFHCCQSFTEYLWQLQSPLRFVAYSHSTLLARICIQRPLGPTTRTLLTASLASRRPFLPTPTINLIAQSRNLTLGSIFNRFKGSPAPSPTVVAHVTKLEAEANVYPHDVVKQLALFDALLETKLKSSYELIINRWERMCEFVRLLVLLLQCKSKSFLGFYLSPPAVRRSISDLLDVFDKHGSAEFGLLSCSSPGFAFSVFIDRSGSPGSYASGASGCKRCA